MELPQHLRLVAPLEGHHGSFTVRACFGQGAPNTAPAFACSEGPAPERASSSQAPLAGKPPRAARASGAQGEPGQWLSEPSKAARARELVVRLLRPAPSWAALACFCCRADGLFAWAARSRRARVPELRGRLFSSRRRSLVHHGGFCILSHLSYSRKSIFIIEEHAKRNAGSASIHRVPVHIGELKPKRTESNGSVEFHEMPFVRSG